MCAPVGKHTAITGAVKQCQKDVAHSHHLDKQHGEIKSTQTLRNEQISSDQKAEEYSGFRSS